MHWYAPPRWSTNALMPYWDQNARGVILGLTGDHGKAHVYRAILEGIAFEQRLMTNGAEKGLEKSVESLIALGGGSRSPLWCQIVADVIQRPGSVARQTESTCLGAGMLAAAASGIHGSVKEAAQYMSGTTTHFEPGDEGSARYDRLYGVCEEIYPSLRKLFPKLAEAIE